MLDNPSEKIRECFRRAEEAAQAAKEQPDPRLREDFLEVERRWLLLARSYEFTERLNRFTFKPGAGRG